jgi:hypothetical protein
MKNKNAQPKAELSAKTSRNFIGTRNFRHKRVISALWEDARFREEIDDIGGCSNGPALIAELRCLGLEIPCIRIRRFDKEGRSVWRGVYLLSDSDTDAIERYMQNGAKEGV